MNENALAAINDSRVIGVNNFPSAGARIGNYCNYCGHWSCNKVAIFFSCEPKLG